MKNYIFKNVLLNFISKLFLVILKLSVGVLIAQLFGAFGRGVYVALLSFSGFISTFLSFSIGDSFVFFVNKDKLNKKNIMTLIFFTTILFSCVYLVYILFFSDLFLNLLFKNIGVDFYIFNFFLIPIFFIEYLYFSISKSINNFFIVNTFPILFRVTFIIILLLFYFLENDDLLFFVKIFTLTYFFNILFLAVCVYKSLKPKFSILKGKLISFKRYILFIKYSFFNHLSNIIVESENRFDNFFILFFLNPAALGIYSLAFTFGQLSWYLSNAINSIIYPLFSKSKSESYILDLTKSLIKINFLLNVFLYIFLIIFLKSFLILLFGVDFLATYNIFLIIGIAFIFDSITRVLFTVNKALSNLKKNIYISLSTLCLNIIFNLILIPKYGILGAAFASLFTYLLRFILFLYFFKKISNIKLNELVKLNINDIMFFITSLKRLFSR